MKRRPDRFARIRQRLEAAFDARRGSADLVAGFAAADAVALALSRASRVALHGDSAVIAWLKSAYDRASLQTRKIPLTSLDKWKMDPATGNIEHEAGRFFTILGANIRHRHRLEEVKWNQPYLDQPEVGILGILSAEFGGVLHFCLQAKEEPGNINAIQLSPTVQATFSNYRRTHGGKSPPLVDLFFEPRREDIIFSRLQTEDGGRFLYKSNRNMIVRCDPARLKIPADKFIWLTLRQIVALMTRDNVVNACTRSILSCAINAGALPKKELAAVLRGSGAEKLLDASAWPDAGKPPRARTELRSLIDWRDDQKAITHLHVKRIPLASLTDWHLNRQGQYVHKDGRFFRIVGLRVESRDREVPAWTQPILENPNEGVIGLLVKTLGGRRYVLMQSKAEPGNRPPVQIAPTVQFTPDNYRDNLSLQKPFLFDEFMSPTLGTIISDTHQSEEGARFYHDSHLHRIIEIPAHCQLDLPDNYRWFSLDDVRFVLHIGEMVNSCARSILACLL